MWWPTYSRLQSECSSDNLQLVNVWSSILYRISRLQNGLQGLAKAVRQNQSCPKEGSKPKYEENLIILDIHKIGVNAGGRYFYLLPRFLYEAGYKVVLRTNLEWLGSPNEYGKLITTIPKIKIIHPFKKLPKGGIYISDSIDKDQVKRDRRGILKLKYNWYSAPKSAVSIPYTAHPIHHKKNYVGKTKELRQTPSEIGLLFSGEASPETHEGGAVVEKFGILSRAKIIDTVKSELSSDRMTSGSGGENDKKGRIGPDSRGRNKAVILEGRNISSENWLRTLSSADFFLAAPGRSVPLAHNIIEALAVGTIPITNYAYLMRPPLSENESLLFSTEEELMSSVEEALSMPKARRHEMSAAAAAYFDEHLSPSSFRSRLEREIQESKESPIDIYFNIERST